MRLEYAWVILRKLVPLLKLDRLRLDLAPGEEPQELVVDGLHRYPLWPETWLDEVHRAHPRPMTLEVVDGWGVAVLRVRGSMAVYRGERLDLAKRRPAQEALDTLQENLDRLLPHGRHYLVVHDVYGLMAEFETTWRDDVLDWLREVADQPFTYLRIERDRHPIFRLELDLAKELA